jgi:hypothetical protein
MIGGGRRGEHRGTEQKEDLKGQGGGIEQSGFVNALLALSRCDNNYAVDQWLKNGK